MNIGQAPRIIPAPEPSRSLDLSMGSTNPANHEDLPEGTQVIQQDVFPQERTPSFRSTPPPANPEQAVRESATEGRIGELINAMGEREKRFERQMEEMRLQYEAQMAVLMGDRSGSPQIPTGIDPNAPVKAGELFNVLSRMEPLIQERILRGTWDVTPQEEQAILATNPVIANIQDVAKRTELIQRAARLIRQQAAPNGDSGSSTPAQATSGRSVPQPQVRSLPGRVIPHVEGTTSPRATDHSPVDPSRDFQERYEAAKRIPDKTERLAAMKKVFKESQYAAGISDETLAASKFTQT